MVGPTDGHSSPPTLLSSTDSRWTIESGLGRVGRLDPRTGTVEEGVEDGSSTRWWGGPHSRHHAQKRRRCGPTGGPIGDEEDETSLDHCLRDGEEDLDLPVGHHLAT